MLLFILLNVFFAVEPSEAAVYSLPGKLTLLEDTPFYDTMSDSGEAAGIVSAIQTVRVTGSNYKGKDYPNQSSPEWYRIDTWLGDKWIKNGPNAVNGEYHETDEMTLPLETALYRWPADEGRAASGTGSGYRPFGLLYPRRLWS